MTRYSKTIAAFIGFAAAFAAAKWGFNLDPNMQAAIATAIGTLLVYFVPNKTT